MKTINVSDEVYEFLKECKNELHTQDGRATRNPIYTIWHTKEHYGLTDDYASEYKYYWDDSEYESLEDLYDWMDENGYEDDLLSMYNIYNDRKDNLEEYDKDIIKAWFTDDMNEYEVIEGMESLTGNLFQKIGYSTSYEQVTDGSCFSFFESDANEHLTRNKHNIKGNPYTYVDSLYRSPRMEKLRDTLMNLDFKENENE